MEFISEIIAEHADRLDKKAVVVLPCVHDDADIDHGLFAAAAERYGGTYVNCSPGDGGTLPSGPINNNMANQLVALCAARNSKVEIAEHRGQITVRVDGSDELVGSTATLGMVLAILCSPVLDRELVIMSYALADLDEARAELIWEATCTAKQFAPDRMRTLVPIARGSVNVAAHCNRPEGAVRLVVRYGDLIRRRVDLTSGSRLHNMISTSDRRVVLFLGAGASASCRIPQGDALRDQALAHLTGVNGGQNDLIAAFRRWLEEERRWMNDERELLPEQFGRGLTLERVLREEFHLLKGRPRSEAHTYRLMQTYCARALERVPPGRQALWDLVKLLPRLVVATVNFDELIEDGMSADHVVLARPDEFAAAHDLVRDRLNGNSSTVPILKVHGTISDADSLVADINATSRGLHRDVSSLLDVVAEDHVLWIWIGCSMRDVDLRQWLVGQSADTLEEWWVDPLPPSSVARYADEVRRREWAAQDNTLRARQFTDSSDVFLSNLLKHVRNFTDAAATPYDDAQ